MSEQIVETDGRGRASLGRPNRRYLMHEESDGTLILEPAVVVTELERRFMADAALQAQLDYARHPEQRRRRGRRANRAPPLPSRRFSTGLRPSQSMPAPDAAGLPTACGPSSAWSMTSSGRSLGGGSPR